MAREIKFRAKNTKNEWVYGDYAELAIQGDYLTPSIIDNGFVHAVNPETLGQYTNFDADDGQEICDGDYVKVTSSSPAFCQFGHDKDCEGVVDFIECGFVITDRKTFARPLFTEVNHVEIIGNIHDNPELI